MFPLWKHEDCFPIIMNVILDLCKRKKEGWVLHDEIVNALLDEVFVIKLIADARVYRSMEKQEIVANMVAWFSQKITEYENRNLPENYSQFHLIEEAYITFDRKKMEGRYAYKLRLEPEAVPKVAQEKETAKQEQIQEIRKREEFSKYVESLKKQKVPPEEYRKLIMEWHKKH